MVKSRHMHSYTVVLPFAPWVLAVAAAWSLVLKAFALWHAARGGQKAWFVVLVIVNTLGVLEIVYLLFFRPRSFELEKPSDAKALEDRPGVDSSPA